MNKFEMWMLRRILGKIVMQGGQKKKITRLYGLILEAAKSEYYEDNKPTLRAFMEECHNDAADMM